MVTEQSDFVAAARALDEAFVRHANAGDSEQLVVAYYAADAQVLPPNAPRMQGHSQIRALFQGMLDAGAGDVTLETNQLHVEGGLGYGVGTYTYVIRQPGQEPVRDSGKYVLVYRRQADGSWKVAVDAFSSDLPAS